MVRFWQSLGLGAQLTAALLAVASLTLVAGLIGTVGFQRAFEASAVLEQDAEMIQAVQEIRVALGPLRAPPSDFLIWGDPAAPARYAEALRTIHDRLNRYTETHRLHRHSVQHALSAQALIAATEADLARMEQLGQALFETGDLTVAVARLSELEALTATATARLDQLLRNAIEDIAAARVAQAAARRNALLGLAASAVLAAVMATGFELALTRSITVPLTRLSQATERIVEGNLTWSIPVTAPGEIGQLAGALERLRRRLMLAVLEERDQVCRERHEGRARVLGDVGARIEAVRDDLRSGPSEVVERGLEALLSEMRQAQAEAQEAATELCAVGGVGARGLAGTLAEYAERFWQQSGVPAELAIASTWKEDALSRQARVQLIHVVREALTNVRKHAAATRVVISLTVEANQVEIRVEDDGRGFLLSRHLHQFLKPTPSRHGLLTMRDRARAVGGTFGIHSQPSKGTIITVCVPLEQPAQAGNGMEAVQLSI